MRAIHGFAEWRRSSWNTIRSAPAIDEKNLARLCPEKRFRKYVQIKDGKRSFSKNLMTRRFIDARTGDVIKTDEKGNAADGKVHIWATEILHFPISSYNVALRDTEMGWKPFVRSRSRQSEEVNAEYFDNNTVPPLALLVSGKLGEKYGRKNYNLYRGKP